VISLKNFRQYLKDKLGDGTTAGFRGFKRRFMSEPGHFPGDWIKLMNHQKYCYQCEKNRVKE
jgi:hypothetical protein